LICSKSRRITALNSEEKGINNLDLDENGEVDYIKVDEYIEGDTHVIILQVEIEENDFQDVASIEIEKMGDEEYSLQVVGAEELYGEEYIIEPETDAQEAGTTVVHVHTWPVVRIIFRPGWRRWRSPWRWGARPVWWRPWRPVARSSYRNRWARSGRKTRYRRTTRRGSVRAGNMYKTQRKTAKRYQAPPPTTKKKSTKQKSTKQKKSQQKPATKKKVP
jgi:hypothetical protein